MDNVVIVIGTRPGIIKVSPIIKELETRGLEYTVIHTGQHYSYNMDGVFFEQLRIPTPKYNLHIGSGTYAGQVSRAMSGIRRLLKDMKGRVSIVLVLGDTNACIAGTISAFQEGLPIGHIEAGLRSNFSGMPEEINRVIVDHCSDYLFAPTNNAKSNLLSECIPRNSVYVTGNTIVDAIHQNYDNIKQIISDRYILATVHRQENVDDKDKMCGITAGMALVAMTFQTRIIYPIHPRAKKRLEEFGMKKLAGVEMIEPVDYFEFLGLEKNAILVLTDSGGLQEESCILGVPCVTLRDNTERPETVEIGANILAGTLPYNILKCAKSMFDKRNGWSQPYGDGTAAKKIVDVIEEKYG